MIYTVKYFRPEEFRCKHCGRGGVTPLLVFYLDMLRAAYGNPIHVNSGFRCAEHNAKVGGARRSRHMIGCAADISVTDMNKMFADVCAIVFDMPNWEFKNGGRYIHIGCPRMARGNFWNGGKLEIVAVNADDLISQRIKDILTEDNVREIIA